MSKNTATKDTEDMSLDELEAFITNAQVNEVDVVISETEVEVEVPSDTVVEDDVDNPYFKGKSKKDLIDIIENGTKKISQQGNDLWALKQEIDGLKQTVPKPEVKEDDDDLAGYAEDDLKVIEKVVERKLSAKDKVESDRKTSLVEKAKELNEIVWDSLLKSDQDAIFPEMQKLFVNDPDNTLHRAGWVKEYYHNWKERQSEPEVTVKKKVIQVIGGNKPIQTIKKSEKDMSAEEYLEHCRQIGLNIGG